MRNLIITIIIGIIAPFVTFAQGSNERQVREHYDLLIARYENERYAFQDGYNRWLQEGRGAWSEEEWRHNLQTLRDEITRCDREIARLRNERDNRVREAQQRELMHPRAECPMAALLSYTLHNTDPKNNGKGFEN